MFGQDTNLNGEPADILEDEDIFKTPIKEKEVPELRDDITIIASIESRLNGIQYLLSDIRTLGGMNQTLALEAANYSDDIKNTNINFFTKEPTKTKLSFTKESLWESIKNTFVTIYNWIKEKLRKAWLWLVGLFKSEDEKVTDKDFEAAKRKAEQNEYVNDKAWETVISHLEKANKEYHELNKHPEIIRPLVPDGEAPDLFNFTLKVLEKRPDLPIARLIDTGNPFIHDIVNMGPYIKLIKDIAYRLPNIQLQLKGKTKKLVEVMHDYANVEHTPSIIAGISEDLAQISKPLVFLVSNKKVTSDELLNLLHTTRNRVANETRLVKFTFQDLVTRLFINEKTLLPRRLNENHSKAVKSLLDIEEDISTIMNDSYQLEFGEHNEVGNSQFVADYRRAISVVTTEINSFTIILRYVKMTLDTLFYAFRDVTHFNDTILDWVLEHGIEMGVDVPSKLKEFSRAMKARRDKNYASYKRYIASSGF